MPYGTPAESGSPEYSGSVSAYATDEVNYGADINISFKMAVNGVAVAAPDIEGLCDPNFQSFLDHVAAWEGFTLPPNSEYTQISVTQLYAGKTQATVAEVTPTEEPA